MRPGAQRTGLRNLEEAFGGREAIVEKLSFAHLDDKQKRFLGMLADPMRAQMSLASLCAEAEILPGELMELCRSADGARAIAMSQMKMFTRLPEVVEDVIDKSIDKDAACPRCHGVPRPVDQPPCSFCAGTGRFYRESSIDHQKLIGDWSGLNPKKAGFNINVGVQQNVGVVTPGGFFSKIVRSSDDAAYNIQPAELVDGEKVSSHEESGRTDP